MPRAYILVNVETGGEEKVLKSLQDAGIVEEGYVSYGVYDLVLKVHTETLSQLKDVVTHKIRSTSQVQSTLTLVMTEE